MHHMLFPQNSQTATFCSYKDDNESEPRWMSGRGTAPRPALLPGRWSPACTLLSLGPRCSMSHCPLHEEQDRWSQCAYIHKRTHRHALTNTNIHTGFLFTSGTSPPPKHSCSQRSRGILGAASPPQTLHHWISGTDGWINRKSMGLHGVRMQGYFSNYGKCCCWSSVHISPLLSHLTCYTKPFLLPGLGSV